MLVGDVEKPKDQHIDEADYRRGVSEAHEGLMSQDDVSLGVRERTGVRKILRGT